MTFDIHSLEAVSTIASVSGSNPNLSITVQAGDGAKFGNPQNVTIWPAGTRPTKANSTIGRISAISTDTLTITTAQETSSNISVTSGMNIANTNTPKVLTDIETALSNLPVSMSKLFVAGHSYAMPLSNTVNAGFGPGGLYFNGGSLRDRGQFPNMLQDAFGIGGDRKYYTITISNVGALQDTSSTIIVEEDCVIEAVSIIPPVSIGSSTTQYRKWTVSVPTGPYVTTPVVIGYVDSQAGVTGGTEYIMCNFNGTEANQSAVPTSAYQSASGVYSGSPVFVAGNNVITINSTHVGGTGKVESGTMVVVRTGGRFRNMAVGGSMSYQSGVYHGGWASVMNPDFDVATNNPQCFASPVNLSAKLPATHTTASGTMSTSPTTVTVASTSDFPASGTFSLVMAGGAQTVTYTGGGGGGTSFTGCTIASGTHAYNNNAAICATSLSCTSTLQPLIGGYIIFANGTIVAVNGIFGATSTSITINAQTDAGTVAINQQGMQFPVLSPYGYESLTSPGLSVLCWGINEAGSSSFDVVALRETIRAVASFRACAAIFTNNNPVDGNVVLTAGNGAAAAWGAFTQPAAGQFGNSISQFTGAVGGTPPTITINLGVGFDGGALDLFFIAQAGSTKGGAATITVDGATPPQGAVTINTSGASPTANFATVNYSVAGTTALTLTSGVFNVINDLGRIITGTNIPAGTYISAIADTTHATLSQSATGTTSAAGTMYGFIPMVKRLTGLSAAAHTITITLTGIDATDKSASFMYLGYGFEPITTLQTPVVICNAPKILSTTAYAVSNTDTNVTAVNLAFAQVVAGTAAAISGNSVEPALSGFTSVADLDTAINKTVAYFSADGLHPNTLGHTVIASTILNTVRGQITQQQAISR